MANSNWFEIQNNAKSETADVYIYSEIGSFDVNAKSFIDELKTIKDKNIDVHINSLGGDSQSICNVGWRRKRIKKN